MRKQKIIFILIILILLLSANIWAAPPSNNPSFTINVKGVNSWSLPVKIAVLLTFLSLLPTLFVILTSFTRILITFYFLKQALGAREMPPSQVIVGLSLFLTVFIMTPTFNNIYSSAIVPYEKGRINEMQAVQKASIPLKTYMLKQTREKDLKFIISLSKSSPPKNREAVQMTTLIPAYILSEIKTGFEIGFLLYIPFLIIDVVVASILVSLGMIFLPPVMVSLPFKIILFIMADGWTLLVGALVKSFGG
jgi:flagellar biosynthetic protein FliP